MRFSAAVAGLDVPPPTARRLRHSANCWSRHTPDRDLSLLTIADFDTFRRSCRRRGLSPVTIESIISDVIYVARRHEIILAPGRRLRRPTPVPHVPSLGTIGRLYLQANRATWPRRSWVSPADWWRCLLVVLTWTGFRRGDLARLCWNDVQADRIVLVAGKSSRRHEIPLNATAGRHLQLLNGRGHPERIFDLPQSTSYRACYDQLARLSVSAGCQVITLQQIRCAAITNWSSVNAEAGRIIHGCGLGVMGHYLDPFAVLQAVAPAVTLPDVFLSDEERQLDAVHRRELLDAWSRGNRTQRNLILGVARAIIR